MPVNHYFQGGNGIGNQNEKRLHEDLIVEGLKIYGHDVYYLPRTLVNRDLILGEDTTSRFDDSWLIEMYIESTEGFGTPPTVVAKRPVISPEIMFSQNNTILGLVQASIPYGFEFHRRPCRKVVVGAFQIQGSQCSKPHGPVMLHGYR